MQHEDAVFDTGGARFFIEQLQRLVDGLMREAEGAVVHRDHPAGVEVEEGARSVGRVGVDVAELRRVVGADGQQREFGG